MDEEGEKREKERDRDGERERGRARACVECMGERGRPCHDVIVLFTINNYK